MGRDEVVKLLRQQEKMRLQVQSMDRAMEFLTECEQEIIDKMFLHPVPKASDKICEMFEIEVAAVYRRRNKALKKLADFLTGVG